jgi:hypothetical protein
VVELFVLTEFLNKKCDFQKKIRNIIFFKVNLYDLERTLVLLVQQY